MSDAYKAVKGGAKSASEGLVNQKLGLAILDDITDLDEVEVNEDTELAGLINTFDKFDSLTYIQKKFLAGYLLQGTYAGAARLTGVSAGNHYRWTNPKSSSYNAEFVEAKQLVENLVIDALEDEATRRAVYGYDKDVYYKGEVVGQQKVYSDNLLMFLLKGKAPEKYRDFYEVKHNVTGTVDVVNRIAGLTDDEMRAIADIPIKKKHELRKAEEEGTIIDVTP